MPRMTSERFLSLIEAAESAIDAIPKLALQLKTMRNHSLTALVEENKIDRDHPLYPLVNEIESVYTHLIETVSILIPIEAVRIVTMERAYFNQSRLKGNDAQREYMRTRRANHIEPGPRIDGSIDFDLDYTNPRPKALGNPPPPTLAPEIMTDEEMEARDIQDQQEAGFLTPKEMRALPLETRIEYAHKLFALFATPAKKPVRPVFLEQKMIKYGIAHGELDHQTIMRALTSAGYARRTQEGWQIEGEFPTSAPSASEPALVVEDEPFVETHLL